MDRPSKQTGTLPPRDYAAFISYRHADNKEPGRQWATWLHQVLETYEVPPDLVGSINHRGEPIPAGLYPVFRDEEELPADADLTANIRRALERSRVLVVICSPRATASRFVGDEIRYFKEIGKSDHILALMIDGEPNVSRDPAKQAAGIDPASECLPEPLRCGAPGADAWHGQPYLAGAGTIPSPAVTNLWLAAPGDTARAWRNPAIVASGLPGTFLLVANADEPEPDARAVGETEITEKWRDLIEIVIGERICGETARYELSAPAAERFLAFRARTRPQQSPGTCGFTDWWPEQLLKITLLMHLATLRPEVPPQIVLATMEGAIGIMECLGAAQLRAVSSMATPRRDFEAEVELMVARVRLKGPMPKWTLFKGFHTHRAEVMEPLLARCCERNLLRVEDNLVQLADADS